MTSGRSSTPIPSGRSTGRQRLAAGEDAAGDAAHLWWIAGLAERLLGDIAAARSLAWRRRPAGAGRAVIRRCVARVTISLALDVGNGGDLTARWRCSTASRPMSTRPTARASPSSAASSTTASVGSTPPSASLRTAYELAAAAGDVLTDAAGPGQPRRRRVASGERRRRARAPPARRSRSPSSTTRSRWARPPLPTSPTSRPTAGQPARGAGRVRPRRGRLLRRTGTLVELPRLHADHALALADANLLDDAEHLIDRAVELSAAGGNDLELAELLLVSAEIDLAKGKPDEAHVSAVERRRRVHPPGPRQLAARRRAARGCGPRPG